MSFWESGRQQIREKKSCIWFDTFEMKALSEGALSDFTRYLVQMFSTQDGQTVRCISIIPMCVQVGVATCLVLETQDGQTVRDEERWLVVNFHQGMDDMSTELRDLCQV